MDTNNICLDLKLHYFIEGEAFHLMDARAHNRAEYFLLKAISEL